MGWFQKDAWRTHRHLHRGARSVRRFVASYWDEIVAAPKKTFVDVFSGIPIAALAVPRIRNWLLALPYASVGLVALVSLRVVFGAWRRGRTKSLIEEQIGEALKKVMPVIESTRIHASAAANGDTLPKAQIERNIQVVLSAMVDLARQALQVPDDVALVANLMLPMPVELEGSSKKYNGCGIVVYNDMPANPSWTRLAIGDLGAGEVFKSGKVQVVDDTTDPVWCGLFAKSRAKSFASFPVRVNSVVVAVVNVDADHPMVLSRKNATALFERILSPPLKLLGDLLVAIGVANA